MRTVTGLTQLLRLRVSDAMPSSNVAGRTGGTVIADPSLAIALDRMGSSKLRVLPVVSRANVRHLIGVVTLDAVLSAYGIGPR